jgi:hypothetical protein
MEVMAVNKTTYAQKSKIFTQLMLKWNESESSDFLFDSFISELISDGWERKDIYFLLMSFNKNCELDISNDADEYICDVLTSITGHCAFNCLMRFPHEPKEEQALLDYVHGNLWK